jgi:signal transduction histidine kinase
MRRTRLMSINPPFVTRPDGAANDGTSGATGELPLRAASEKALAEGEAASEPLVDLSLAGHLLLPLAIFVISLLGINFTHLAKSVLLWPANAVLLVALLRHNRTLSNYGSILVGGISAMVLAGLVAGDPPFLIVILTGANVIEIVTAWTLLAALRIGATNLTSFRNLLSFIVIAGGIAPFASALIGALAFGSVHGIPWFTVWRSWYPVHALGMVIIAPFLISVTSNEWQVLRIKRRRGEAIAVLVLVVAVALCASYFRSIIFLTAPVVLFATVRFGLIGATVATFVIALLASVFVVLGIGQAALSSPEVSDRMFALQLFLAIMSLWSLPTAALLTERDRLLTDLSRANSRLTAESERKSHLVIGLRRHLSKAEENERLRLSHELHDQAGQGLIAAILELNEIDPLVQGAARDRLHSVRKKMEEMGKILHRIAWELRPPSIDELGLRKALASYIADWGEQCGTDADFHCDDPSLDEVPSEIGTAIYRVVQEGLTNIVKHAGQPSSVSVVIRRVDAVLQIIVEDDGCGFDTAAAAKTGGYRGLGLDGMRERLFLIGGTLEIESARGAGTTIFARIALDGQRSAA